MTTELFNHQSAAARIQGKIEDFHAEALREIAGLDSQIESKLSLKAEVERSICLEDAAAAIEASIRHSLDGVRRHFDSGAASSVFLHVHEDTLTISNNANGERKAESRTKRRLDLLPYDTSPLTILALLWGDKEIKAFAKTAALAAGAKPAPEGLRVDEALENSNRLHAEIMELEKARQSAVAALGGFSKITLSDLAKEKFEPVFSTMEPSPPPSVKVMGADGVMRPYQADPFAWRGD